MAAEGDVDLLVRDAFFRNRATGVLVEVGAARPDYLSIGASFRALGWRVIAIEPNPEFCAAHRAMGHDVLEYACSDEDSDDANFFVVDSKGADYQGGTVSFESFSSLGIKDQFVGLYDTVKETTSIRTVPVKVRKLDTILATHAPDLGPIDVLAVDVEGWELNVMRGLTLDRYCPKVIILENVFKDQRYTAFMQEHGYRLWHCMEPNEVYVRPGDALERAGAFRAIVAHRLRRLGRRYRAKLARATGRP